MINRFKRVQTAFNPHFHSQQSEVSLTSYMHSSAYNSAVLHYVGLHGGIQTVFMGASYTITNNYTTIIQKRLISHTPTSDHNSIPLSNSPSNKETPSAPKSNSETTESPKVSNVVFESANDSSEAQRNPNGIKDAFTEFFRDVKANIYYDANNNNKLMKRTFADYINILKGADKSQAEQNKERMKKEVYHNIIREKQQQEKEEELKVINSMSWVEYLKHVLKSTVKSFSDMTSTNTGVMALLQHCTTYHMAEVAVEENIDVKNIKIVLEPNKATGVIDKEHVIVGYIDAPGATEEEVKVYASKLSKACPAANMMKNRMEWRKMPVEGLRPEGEGRVNMRNTTTTTTSGKTTFVNTNIRDTDFMFPPSNLHTKDPFNSNIASNRHDVNINNVINNNVTDNPLLARVRIVGDTSIPVVVALEGARGKSDKSNNNEQPPLR